MHCAVTAAEKEAAMGAGAREVVVTGVVVWAAAAKAVGARVTAAIAMAVATGSALVSGSALARGSESFGVLILIQGFNDHFSN